MRLSKTQIIGFQKKIFTWWRKNKRDLPWRHTHDPYNIFISEVMLQQTQVFRVVPKYRELVERYPTVTDLSRASTADVLRAWKGMGYNRRAVYLKKIAETVTRQYDGKFPTEEQTLRALPGVGSYTAAAILVFAYKQDVAMVETNIRKIITHFFFNDIPQKEVIILDTARQLVPKGKSWQWHQALMDYGALVLSKNKTIKRNRKNPSVPFKQSDRYFRGQIVNDLRLKSMSIRTLKQIFMHRFDLSQEKITFIVTKLKKDGIIQIKHNVVSLAD